ncbi:MAG: TadE/TadG family type IV pilus assembly protein [Pseudomonadota bacterium]
MRKQFSIRRRLQAYRRDKKGVAAIEFLFLLPILLTLLLGGLEVVLYTWQAGRVQDTASSVSDLVSQNASMDEQRIRSIYSAAHRMLDPLDEGDVDLGDFELTVSSVIGCPCNGDLENATENSNYCYTVLWSHRLRGDLPSSGEGIPEGRTVGTAVDFVPSELVRAPDETMIVTEAEFDYKPDFQYVLVGSSFKMDEITYFRPRLSDRVVHTGDQAEDTPVTCESLLNN